MITIGAYDGVHLGHQAVVAEVRRIAEKTGARSAVLTFDRHPASIVRPESAPKLLTDLDQKLELLAATGIDATLVVRFDEAQSLEAPMSFAQRVLVDCVAASAVVVGEDFHFGHGREGNVATLLRDRTCADARLMNVPGKEAAGGGLSGSRSARLVAAAGLTGAIALALSEKDKEKKDKRVSP